MLRVISDKGVLFLVSNGTSDKRESFFLKTIESYEEQNPGTKVKLDS